MQTHLKVIAATPVSFSDDFDLENESVTISGIDFAQKYMFLPTKQNLFSSKKVMFQKSDFVKK